MSTIKTDYDKENDVLYISLGNPVPSFGEEDDEGIIIRKSKDTHELSGVTIIKYKYRIKKGMKINLPKEIDISRIKV